ncbi:hypothetical protein GCM10027053_25210 [Intrasporangium mesophilum]
MSAPAPPAGWYPTPEGDQRYWDGQQWSEHVAPGPSAPTAPAAAGTGGQPARSTSTDTRHDIARPGLASWLGWGGLGVTTLLGAASSGVSGALVLAGTYVLVVAIVALARGHVDWARLRGRGAGGAAVAAAFALFAVAAATAGPTDVSPVAVPTDSSSAPLTASPQASDTPTPTPTTPTPTTPTPTTPSPTAPTVGPETAEKGTALAAVADLTVKGRAPKTGYSRDQFGQAWFDADRNGCDTRNDVLRRDLKNFTLKAGTNGCLVLSGTLVSPYTGNTIRFVRGQDTSSAVQIDHVVALSDAWQKGAQKLSLSSRTAFANDPLNLLAVDGTTNQAKGDGDAATWLPPKTSNRCSYVARQVAVKVKYDLWVTQAEHDAMARILQTCPNQVLPTSKAIPLGGGPVQTVTPAPQRTTTPPPAKPPTATDPRFATCKAANAAGYGPYYQGKDPEYDWYTDRDHDGIVCE